MVYIYTVGAVTAIAGVAGVSVYLADPESGTTTVLYL